MIKTQLTQLSRHQKAIAWAYLKRLLTQLLEATWHYVYGTDTSMCFACGTRDRTSLPRMQQPAYPSGELSREDRREGQTGGDVGEKSKRKGQMHCRASASKWRRTLAAAFLETFPRSVQKR